MEGLINAIVAIMGKMEPEKLEQLLDKAIRLAELIKIIKGL